MLYERNQGNGHRLLLRLRERCKRGARSRLAYDEMKGCGAKFDNFFTARSYDKYHQTFRDYRRETEQIVTALGLDSSAAVLDMGCGTGAFAIHAAPHYRKIYAVVLPRPCCAVPAGKRIKPA